MVSRKITVAALSLLAFSTLVTASPAELFIFPEQSSTEVNSFTSYEVTVENVGPVKDVYRLDSRSSEVTVAPERVELEPGSSETVNVWYNPGPGKKEGDHRFTVTAKSRATGKKYKVEGIATVIREHEVGITARKRSKVTCLGKKAVYTIKVKNNGMQRETFRLSADFGKLSSKKVTLEDGASRKVRLVLSSEKPLQRNFNVVASSTSSYAEDVQNLNFRAEQCWASEVSVTPKKKNVPAFTEADYRVTVRNTGTRPDEFVLSASRGELSLTSMEISSKSSKTVNLTVSPEKLGKKSIKVTASSKVTSTGRATMNVRNGMRSSVDFDSAEKKVCEDEDAAVSATVTNTGAAEETFNLSASRGDLEEQEVELEKGESEEVDVEFDSENLTEGKTYSVRVASTATTFGGPSTSSTSKLQVLDCWNAEVNIVPEVKSSGKNRSVIYEFQVENTGARENSYNLSLEAPEWIEVKPRSVTVKPGKTETAHIYAGIPFQQEGEVNITGTARGRSVEKSESVRLVIGEEVKEAIKSPKGSLRRGLNNLITGAFNTVDASGNLGALGISLVLGALITLAVLMTG